MKDLKFNWTYFIKKISLGCKIEFTRPAQQ